MTRPCRIQMRRDRPWRADYPDAVIVARPSRWGNPFTVDAARSAGYDDPQAVAVRAFRDWLSGIPWACGCMDRMELRRAGIRGGLHDLRGRDLACWCRLCARHADGLPLGETCPDCAPCHADVLLEIANAEAGT